jgi:hypothetical protein
VRLVQLLNVDGKQTYFIDYKKPSRISLDLKIDKATLLTLAEGDGSRQNNPRINQAQS